jgi:sortase A
LPSALSLSRGRAETPNLPAPRVSGRGRRDRHRARRVFGLIVFGIGFLLVAGTALQLLRGSIARERARAAWNKQMRASALTPALAALGMGTPKVAAGTPLVRVMIPTIRLDEVVVEGIADRDLWSGPGHVPGTVLPGMNGNSVVSAHRDRHFHRLDDVRVGDVLETQTPFLSVLWRVTQRRIVGKDERVIYDSDSPMLTLTTCWPTRFVGPAPDRLILTAEPVSMKERQVGPQAIEDSVAR